MLAVPRSPPHNRAPTGSRSTRRQGRRTPQSGLGLHRLVATRPNMVVSVLQSPLSGSHRVARRVAISWKRIDNTFRHQATVDQPFGSCSGPTQSIGCGGYPDHRGPWSSPTMISMQPMGLGLYISSPVVVSQVAQGFGIVDIRANFCLLEDSTIISAHRRHTMQIPLRPACRKVLLSVLFEVVVSDITLDAHYQMVPVL